MFKNFGIEFFMKKFVSSVIYSLIMTFVSVAVIFLLQAPLMSLVYYGFLAGNNSANFNMNVVKKLSNTDAITIVVLVVQVLLTFCFIFAMFRFISKVIHIFLKDEKLIRPYYLVFFFMSSVVPVVLIFLSIFLKIRLTIMTLVVEGVFTALNMVIIIFSRKILPDTTDHEYRKYLFSEGLKND